MHDEARRAEIVRQAAGDHDVAHLERVAVIFAADVLYDRDGLCETRDERHIVA